MIQNQYTLNLASKDLRTDKRKPDDFRKIETEKNPIEKAEGSARIKLGGTDVLVGVKLNVGEPFPDKLDEGVLITNAEFSPLASPTFEKGPPNEKSIELARVIDRGIRESGTIDTKKLCIKPKEKVWMVFVDIQILNHDGNLIDASALASTLALLNTKIPKYDGEKINHEEKKEKLPVLLKPVAVTFAKIGKNIFIDPSLEEEAVMTARLTVSTKDDGNICAMQKGEEGSFTQDELEKMFEMAVKKGNELRKNFLS